MSLLTWRLRIARTGFLLRLRSLVSTLVVFGGAGVAIGYSVVSRFGHGFDDEEAESRSSRE
jgi:hypothetical protein